MGIYTTAGAAEGIRCRFLEASMGVDAEEKRESTTALTEADGFRISEATAEAFANLAHILDQHEAEKEDAFIDIKSFVFGAAFGLCMAVGLLAVACMLV